VCLDRGYGTNITNVGCFALSACQIPGLVRTVTGRPFFAKRGVAYLLVMGAMVGID
jgi:hypothetical protein